MSRRFVFAVAGLAAATVVSSFAVASYALASDTPPQLRANLPAAALPTVSLDEATSVRANNLIGEEGVTRFGITPDSYGEARRLADTKVGTFYLIPGSRGACIVTFSSAACGDPGAPGERILALAKLTAGRDALVGVGVATDTTHRVTIREPKGSRVISLPVSRGIFEIDEKASVDPSTGAPSFTWD